MMAQTSEPIVIDTTLTKGLAWLRAQHARITLDKGAEFYGQGHLKDAVITTDGVVGRPAEEVKNFGKIVITPGTGPVAEAAAMAGALVVSQAPRATGFYAGQFQTWVNGKKVSRVDPKAIGRNGNVQIADLAPYAAIPEIEVPNGVLFAAYSAIRRQYGAQLAVHFGYRRPQGQFTPATDSPYSRATAINIPVLEIGNPGGSVKTGASRPGRNLRKRARQSTKGRRR
jgi:hypothetical protein